MRHMILKPRLIAEMRAEEMRGYIAHTKAMELMKMAQAHYDKAAELARLAGVPEKTMTVGKCK